MKSWKTNLAGIVVLGLQLGPVLGMPLKVSQALTTVAVASGLIAAKDNNVTGGSVNQGNK